jgi:hypothetical protein
VAASAGEDVSAAIRRSASRESGAVISKTGLRGGKTMGTEVDVALLGLFPPVSSFDVGEVFAHPLLHGSRARGSRATPGAGRARAVARLLNTMGHVDSTGFEDRRRWSVGGVDMVA